MDRQDQKPLSDAELAEFGALFGPPPVLSTEDPKLFQAILDQVLAALHCYDGVDMLLIRHFVYASWKIERYIRHDTIAIERRYRQQLEFQAQRISDQHAHNEAAKRAIAEELTNSPADIARLAALEKKMWKLPKEVARILQQTASEIDHNVALERSCEFREHLDRLIDSETKRRNDALKQLDLYRAGLGQRVSAVTKAIIDAEFKEVGDKPAVAKSQPKTVEPPTYTLDDFQEFLDDPPKPTTHARQ